MSQISARDKRCKGEFNTIFSKSVLRAESPSRRILSVDDTLEKTSIDYMDHPIWSSSHSFSNVESMHEGFTVPHRTCRNAIQKYRRDPRWWFHDRTIMSSSSYSPSSKSFASCPSKKKRSRPMRNYSIIRRFIRWKWLRVDHPYWRLLLNIFMSFWSQFNVNWSTSIADWSTDRTAVNILLT